MWGPRDSLVDAGSGQELPDGTAAFNEEVAKQEAMRRCPHDQVVGRPEAPDRLSDGARRLQVVIDSIETATASLIRERALGTEQVGTLRNETERLAALRSSVGSALAALRSLWAWC